MTLAPAASPVASVVICTYNRPRMLVSAVSSVLASASRTGLEYEIVIADNSPGGIAAPLVADLAEHAVPVRRVSAAPPNISIARNVGLRAVRAPLVAFLDDDLTVSPGWLDALVETLQRTGADIVLGQLRPSFALGAAPPWDPQGRGFTRCLDAPSGTPIIAGGPHRTRGFTVSTATSLWRTASCFTDHTPFDPAFGVSGGEDLDLFLRLEARGRRIVWCAEAVAEETIPAERCALGYSVLRAFSGSQAYAAATIKNATSPWQTAADVMARGALQAAGFGAMVPLQMPWRRAGWQRSLLAASFGLGKVLWWRKLGLYHMEKPPGDR
jgi:succinoglycan biosynthesis protein ExoM